MDIWLSLQIHLPSWNNRR